jgi:tetrahydromethanopterin S-methyltransferase subunit H
MAGYSYAVNVGTAEKPIYYGFNTSSNYEEIAEAVGATVASEVEGTVLYGINKPKAKRVKITYYVNGEEGPTKTVSRFCSTSKLLTARTDLKGLDVDVKGAKKTIKEVD